MEISIAHSSSVSSSNATLLVALELAKATWVVALSAPFSDRISHYSVTGGDVAALLELIGQARSRAEAALGRSGWPAAMRRAMTASARTNEMHPDDT